MQIRSDAAQRDFEADLRLAGYLRALSRVNVATAHDIRGPLNAMVLNLELLEVALTRDPESDIGVRRDRYVGVIREEVKRLHHMIESFLTQTRLTDDTIEPFDLRLVVRDLEALLDPHCRRNYVRIGISVPDAAATIVGSRDALKQATLPLVIHVVDCLPGGGELHLSLESGERAAILTVAGTRSDSPHELADGTPPTRTAQEADAGVAMIRSVVTAHGGQFRIPPGQPMIRYEIELPLSAHST